MSFLARIAARAMGIEDDGVARLAPKDHGLGAMRASVPAEDMPEEAPETGAGAASRLPARRAAAKPEPDEDKKDKDVAAGPAGAARAMAEPQKDDKERKAARQMWRAAAEAPEPETPERDAPVVRAIAPPPDDGPRDQQELPEQTRNEKQPQKALALRELRRDGAGDPAPAAVAGPAAPSVIETGFADADAYGEAAAFDGWRPLGQDGAAVSDAAPAEFAPPSGPWAADGSSPALERPAASAFARSTEPGGVVIEQIDVFVQEPVSQEAARPRLSDPARAAASRYLRAL